MNKAHGLVDRHGIFDLSQEDSFATFAKRFEILQFVASDLAEEIKKVVGMRL